MPKINDNLELNSSITSSLDTYHMVPLTRTQSLNEIKTDLIKMSFAFTRN